MAEAAEVDDADAIDWGRAVDRPEMGSAFDAGHRPRGGFFLGPQAALASTAGEEGTPLDCWLDAAETVDEEDAEEASDEDEAGREAFLRGMYMLNSLPLTALRPLGAPLFALHPVRGKLGGGATAAITCDGS